MNRELDFVFVYATGPLQGFPPRIQTTNENYGSESRHQRVTETFDFFLMNLFSESLLTECAEWLFLVPCDETKFSPTSLASGICRILKMGVEKRRMCGIVGSVTDCARLPDQGLRARV